MRRCCPWGSISTRSGWPFDDIFRHEGQLPQGAALSVQLWTDGQRIIALLSDPLGRGWDLFGTADYQIVLGVVEMRTVWGLVVTCIVIGHVLVTCPSIAVNLPSGV